METLVLTFQITVIVAGIGLLAFWIIRRDVIPPRVLAFLTTLAVNIAIPSLVFASIAGDFSFDKYTDWWLLPLWWLGFSLVAIALTIVFRFISKRDTRREFAISLFFQNAMFFPLVILYGLFGTTTSYSIQLFLFAFLQPTLVFSTYFLFFGKSLSGLKWSRLLNPVLVVTLVAFLISGIGVRPYLPDVIIVIAVVLGAIAAPLLVIVLGGNLYNNFRRRTERRKIIQLREIIKFVLIKNLAFPLVFLGLLILIRPDFPIAVIIILQSAVPPITAIPILTERSGGDQAITDQFLIGSFVFSVVSIPAIIYLFSIFFPFP
jgi:predicted permease